MTRLWTPALMMGMGALVAGCAAAPPARAVPAAEESTTTPPCTGYGTTNVAARLPGGATALAQCIVNEDGTLTDCKLLCSNAPELNAALLNQLSNTKIPPVTYKGKPVRVKYNIPIRFMGSSAPDAGPALAP